MATGSGCTQHQIKSDERIAGYVETQNGSHNLQPCTSQLTAILLRTEAEHPQLNPDLILRRKEAVRTASESNFGLCVSTGQMPDLDLAEELSHNVYAKVKRA
jgi:hypothetical protein